MVNFIIAQLVHIQPVGDDNVWFEHVYLLH